MSVLITARELQTSAHHGQFAEWLLIWRSLERLLLTATWSHKSLWPWRSTLRAPGSHGARPRHRGPWLERAFLLLSLVLDLLRIPIRPLMLVQILAHRPVSEISLRFFHESDRVCIELWLKIQILQLLRRHLLPQLVLVLVVLGSVRVHLVCPLLALLVQSSRRFVQLFALVVDAWREGGRRLLENAVVVARLPLRKEVLFATDAHIVELPINKYDLSIRKTECFAIDQPLNHLQLINYHCLPGGSLLILDLCQKSLQNVIFQWILPSLFRSEIQNGTANFKQVLSDVLTFALKLTCLGVNIQLPLSLVKKCAHFHR